MDSCGTFHEGVRLRRAGHADAGQIADIHKAAVNGLRGTLYHDREIDAWLAAFVPEELIKAIEDLSTIIEVAEYQCRVVGFGVIKADCLVALYILPSYQRKGLGTRLLNHMETLSLITGVQRLWARISLCERKFYAKNSYTILEQKTHLGIRHFLTEKRLGPETIFQAR